MLGPDPHNLTRFLDAQETCFQQVFNELENGRKVTHWMWFIFPQYTGLGRSSTAETYAIKSREEAKAYLDHPILGDRLLQCTELVLQHPNKSAEAIFGYPDYLKFNSCLTLFYLTSAENTLINQHLKKAIEVFYQGKLDEVTVKLLDR